MAGAPPAWLDPYQQDRNYRQRVAKGRAAARLKTFLALLGLLAVPVMYAMVTGWNPLPGALQRLSEVHRFSEPNTAWSVRLDDVPTAAAQGSGVVLIFEQGTVEARNTVTGAQIWTRTANWAAVAGSARTGGVVVLLGSRGGGYTAVDSADGHERWRDARAIGVWTFSDQVISITCPQPFSCTLAGHTSGSGVLQWQAPVDGNGHSFAGANKPLAGLRPLDAGYAESLAGLPQPAPSLLGLRIDDQVQVYSTQSGQRVRTYRSTPSHWVTVAGSLVLVTSSGLRSSRCQYHVSAQDPVNGQEVWSKSGWDLDTSGGLGCDQRRDPLGGAGLLAATDPDGRSALLRVRDGTEVYQAPAGQQILATDGEVIVVRSAGGKSVQAVRDQGAPLWSRVANRHASVGMTPDEVLITDPDAGRLAAVRSTTGEVLLDAKTDATVLGYAEHGLLISVNRTVGLLPYGSIAP